jgi:hypothetical protein
VWLKCFSTFHKQAHKPLSSIPSITKENKNREREKERGSKGEREGRRDKDGRKEGIEGRKKGGRERERYTDTDSFFVLLLFTSSCVLSAWSSWSLVVFLVSDWIIYNLCFWAAPLPSTLNFPSYQTKRHCAKLFLNRSTRFRGSSYKIHIKVFIFLGRKQDQIRGHEIVVVGLSDSVKSSSVSG